MRTIEIKVPESITDYDVRLATSIDAFNRGLVSLNRAVEIAEGDQLIVELRKRDTPAFPYSDEEARRELEIYPRPPLTRRSYLVTWIFEPSGENIQSCRDP